MARKKNSLNFIKQFLKNKNRKDGNRRYNSWLYSQGEKKGRVTLFALSFESVAKTNENLQRISLVKNAHGTVFNVAECECVTLDVSKRKLSAGKSISPSKIALQFYIPKTYYIMLINSTNPWFQDR